MVFPPLQELKCVSMPGFQVRGKGNLAFLSAVNVVDVLVEDPEHREGVVADTIGATDMRARCGEFPDGKSDATCTLGDLHELI